MKRRLLLLCYCLLIVSQLTAQTLNGYTGQNGYGRVSITYPIEGGVIQRRTDNKASFTLAGQGAYGYYAYQYRIDKLNPVDGTTIIMSNVRQGYFPYPNTTPNILPFYTSIKDLDAGWYRLSVNVWLGGTNFTNTVINNVPENMGWISIKFGIGDNYIIVGQSNASGFSKVYDSTPNEPSKDLISYDTQLSDVQLPDACRVLGYFHRNNNDINKGIIPIGSFLDGMPFYKTMEKLTLNKQASATDYTAWERPVYPNGLASWCWAPLGKKYVANQQVPIQFFNAAIDGSSILQWQKNFSTNDIPAGRNFYNRLLNLLKLQVNILGNRGILFHQGEADAADTTMTQFIYQTNLQNLVDNIQTDFDNARPLTWDISQVSYTTKYDPHNKKFVIHPSNNNILNAQSQVSFSNSTKKTGISTDYIDSSRRSPTQKIHFHNTTHDEVAELWMGNSPKQANTGVPNPLWNNTPMNGQEDLIPISVSATPTNGYYTLQANPDPSLNIAEYHWVKDENPVENTFATTSSISIPASSADRIIYTCYMKPTGKNYYIMSQPFIGLNSQDANSILQLQRNSMVFTGNSQIKNNVVLANNVTWTSSVADNWASIIQNSTGDMGNFPIQIQVGANTTNSPRSTTVTFTGNNPSGEQRVAYLTTFQDTGTGCPQNLTITNNIVNSGTQNYQASQTITANNQITNSNITYQAGNAVTLQAGFKADNSNVFVAKIGACSSSSTACPTPTINISNNNLCTATLTANGCTGTVNWSNGSHSNSITISTTETTNYSATCTTSLCTSDNSNILQIPYLPNYWISTDVGNPTIAGCTQYNAGNLVSSGSGYDFNLNNSNTTDAFHFSYLPQTGDVIGSLSITVKISNLINTIDKRAGITIRSSTDNDAQYFSIIQDGNGAVASLDRTINGISRNFLNFTNGLPIGSTWLKIDKIGNSLNANYSTDGSTWNTLTSNISINFPNVFLAGTIVYDDNGSTNQATFSNISINGNNY